MRTALLVFVLALLCQACNQQNTKTEADTANPEAQAQQLILSGQHHAAADEYTRLARLYPQNSIFYLLRAADSLLQANANEEAEHALAQITPATKIDGIYKNILLARLALTDNNAQAALSYLSVQPPAEMADDIIALWHESKAQAYELSQNFIKASEERIQLDALLLDPLARKANIKQIWSALNRINVNVLHELSNSSSSNLAAWIELTLINQTLLFKPEQLQQAITSWQEHYPGHAAIPLITGDIMALAEKAVLKPQRIALLLPLSGQYEKAAHAIRDGFFTAWYATKGSRPLINIYDSNSLNINTVYQQAINDGADFVVGPLEKQAIEALLQSSRLEVTTLALNQVDKAGKEHRNDNIPQIPRLIQFGLSPEDEARQAAERAIFDGHNRALVITPNNDWGLRLAEAFTGSWQALGGKVLEYVSYDPRSLDYSTPVKKILNIDSSQLRANRLRQKISRNLKSEPRMRQDADMIFMAAVPLSARQIIPQLRFHLASGIPVYSTSHSYSGVENTQADSDMNGVVFTDIPALLKPAAASFPIHAKLDQNWSASTSTYRRLYSLGVDAYQMIPFIGKLSLQETAVYKGETGDLYMSANGHILRKLLWAKFVNGRPALLDDNPVY